MATNQINPDIFDDFINFLLFLITFGFLLHSNSCLSDSFLVLNYCPQKSQVQTVSYPFFFVFFTT